MTNATLQDIFSFTPEQFATLETIFSAYRNLPENQNIVSLGYEKQTDSMIVELENGIHLTGSVGSDRVEYIVYDDYADEPDLFICGGDTYAEALAHLERIQQAEREAETKSKNTLSRLWRSLG